MMSLLWLTEYTVFSKQLVQKNTFKLVCNIVFTGCFLTKNANMLYLNVPTNEILLIKEEMIRKDRK